jgi:oligopeptidase B
MPTPPIAKRVPHIRRQHGDEFVDEYAWLADREDPDTLAYLRAENDYAEQATAHLAGLRKVLFDEIKSRTQETDLSVPSRHRSYWYYARTEAGRQYGISCRRLAEAGEVDPPEAIDGGPLPGEQVLLDGNALAEGHEHLGYGTFDVAPNEQILAYSTDFTGDERFTVRFKDLRTGDDLPDVIDEAFYGGAWSADSGTFFYLRIDDAWRPYQVWRHRLGTAVDSDTLVFQEDDPRFWLSVDLTRSEQYLMIDIGSKTTSEVHLWPADQPEAAPRMLYPRRDGVEYSIEHQGSRFLVLHNETGINFQLDSVPVDGGDRMVLIPHRDDTRLLSVDAFADHVVVQLRRDGLTAVRLLRDALPDLVLPFPEPIYTVALAGNPDYRTDQIRLSYCSLVTPDTVYDYRIERGELVLRKQKPVLGGYDPGEYEQFREWAVAADGTRVPVSLVCRRGLVRDGTAPALLYGYGAYESSTDPWFSVARLSLLERGMVFAIAHVRGGGELGRHWYDDGKLLAKRNTFTDFIACASHLARTGWTSPDRLIGRGGSAGGLLIGAVANLAPAAFGGLLAEVPFVDPVTTMLDPDAPLTAMEWEEWGNPLESAEVYGYMKGYSPYENVDALSYPPILVITSLNDTRVLYHEPAKWVARLRRLSPETPVIMRTEMDAGHSGRSGRYDAWHEEAYALAWVLDRSGLADT